MKERAGEIAVPGPLRRTFTYSIPDHLDDLTPGQRVLVPFGKRRIAGYYLGRATPPPDLKLKKVARVLDDRTLVQPDLFTLCLWMADYYFANPADCLALTLNSAGGTISKPKYHWTEQLDAVLDLAIAALFKPGKKLSPLTLKRIKGAGLKLESLLKEGIVVERWDETAGKRAEQSESENLLDFIAARPDVATLRPTNEQQGVFDRLLEAVGQGFKTFLLHGVTGAGKTLVYCLLCREMLKRSQSVLVLTPEIALAGTTLSYFRGFFGDDVTILHSAMSAKERRESWQGIKSGKFRIVIGPRSALFAPMQNLGLIIVDEEHDSSYKQDDPAPRFHGRDSAIMRAKICNVPILLGSASPSLESYHNAKTGRYELLQLTRRPESRPLPEVQIVDMRSNRLGGDLPFLSFQLKRAVETRIAAKEQTILFINRRGYSPQLKCTECGFTAQCPKCQVTLTYHRTNNTMQCHYCGHAEPAYSMCPSCKGSALLHSGAGTQKAEETVLRLIDGATVVRFDSDSARGRRQAYEILHDFMNQKHNVLLGTQMVTKGLDLPDVTLVGVLSADASLDMPDFRSTEKTFDRLLQVAGRSGRSTKPGTVLVQTWHPDHPVILMAARQEYVAFFEQEIESRQALSYPPFSRIVNIIFSGKTEPQVESSIAVFRDELLKRISGSKFPAQVLGPVPCPLYRLRSEYRRHLFAKTQNMTRFVQMLREWELESSRFGTPSTVKVTIDVDPDDMM